MRSAQARRSTRAGAHTLQNLIHDARQPTFPGRAGPLAGHPLAPRRTDARPGRLVRRPDVGKRRVTSLAGGQRVQRAFAPARRAGLPALRPASPPQPLQGGEALLLRREPLPGTFAECGQGTPRFADKWRGKGWEGTR